MQPPVLSYHGYRFPPEIISHAVWLYHRSCLNFRDVENLLARRAILVSYETMWRRLPASECQQHTRAGRLRSLSVKLTVTSELMFATHQPTRFRTPWWPERPSQAHS